jgi:predicted XRE-type DNA-binding protein
MSFPSSAHKTDGSQYEHTPEQAQRHQRVMHQMSQDPFGNYMKDPTQASMTGLEGHVKATTFRDAEFDSSVPWGKQSLTPAQRRSGVAPADMRVGAAPAAPSAPPMERSVAPPTAPAPGAMPAPLSHEPNRSANDTSAPGVSGFLPASSVDVPAVPWFHGPAARVQREAEAAKSAAASAAATAAEAPPLSEEGVLAHGIKSMSANAPHGRYYRVPDLASIRRPDNRPMSEEEEAILKQNAVRAALSKPVFGSSKPEEVEASKSLFERARDAVMGRSTEAKPIKPADPAVAAAVREGMKKPSLDAVRGHVIADSRPPISEEPPLLQSFENRGLNASMNAPGPYYKVPELGHLKRADGRAMSPEEEEMVHRSAVRAALSKPIFFGRSVADKVEESREDARVARAEVERRIAGEPESDLDRATARRLAARYSDSPIAGLSEAAPPLAENGVAARIKDAAADVKAAAADTAGKIRREIRDDAAAIHDTVVSGKKEHVEADMGRQLAARYADSPVAGLTEAAPDPAVAPEKGFFASIRNVFSSAGDAIEDAKETIVDNAQELRADARAAAAPVERRASGVPEPSEGRRLAARYADSPVAGLTEAAPAVDNGGNVVNSGVVSRIKDALSSAGDAAADAKAAAADKAGQMRREIRDDTAAIRADAAAIRDAVSGKKHIDADLGRKLAAHYADSPVAGLTEAAPDPAVAPETGFLASIKNVFSSAGDAIEDAKETVVDKAHELRADARASTAAVERRVSGLIEPEEGRRLAARYADSPVAGLSEVSHETAAKAATGIAAAINGVTDAARDAATYAVSYAEAEPEADKKGASGRGPTAGTELSPDDKRRAAAAAAAAGAERDALFREWQKEAERARGTSAQHARDAELDMLIRRDWTVEENVDALQRAIAVATREQSALHHSLTASRWSIAAESGIGLMSAYLLYNSAPLMSAWMPGSPQRRAGLGMMARSVRSPMGITVGILGMAFCAIFMPAELAHYRHNRAGLRHLNEVKEGFAMRRRALLTKRGARAEDEEKTH